MADALAPSLRVALVHHWLVTHRGGERVLAEIAALFPEAPIFTLFFDPAAMPPELARRDVRSSFLDPLRRRHQATLPLHPLAVASLDLRGYDLVLTSDAACVKSVRIAPDATHLCYCYTPMRWAWGERRLYVESSVPRPLRPLAFAGLAGLRAFDRAGARRVDAFATCSAAVAARIRACYGRDAEVVPPPVDLDTFTPDPAVAREDFYLCVGELVPYKRLERAVEAFSGSGRRLRVIGDGPLRRSLRRLAGPGVELLGSVPTAELLSHYRRCRALIVPAEEDFGIASLEAQACGAPVVGCAAGGTGETLAGPVLGADGTPCTPWPEHPTGLLFSREDARGLAEAVACFERESARFRAAACVANAGRFSSRAFRAGFTRWVESCLARRAPGARAPAHDSGAPRGSRSASAWRP